MNKTTPLHFLVLFFVFAISACGSARDVNQPVLLRDAGGSYSSVFNIQFTGEKNWIYQLTSHESPALHEINLHIEGLPAAQNPGDVRLVSDNVTTWMIGEGTDQQCVQYPNGKGMDPTFIYPESLISLTALDGALKLVGEEQLNDIPVLHFRATGVTSGPWKEATIDFWQEKASGMLRRFAMTATGEDPFFATGSGKLDASYSAGPLTVKGIVPVPGCEVSVPLPESISMFVRLPGMASFESKTSIEDLVKFFQTQLPGQNWVEKEPPFQDKGDSVLSYQRDAEAVEIHIEANPAGGSAVKLLFTQGQ